VVALLALPLPPFQMVLRLLLLLIRLVLARAFQPKVTL
jgi:hypothetical protein